jgi:Protein of unknown function DUF262
METSPNSLHFPLEKPPQAFSLTVRKVLGKVSSGEIRVPDFQRPLRWKASDVVKLFDSILKGYPVGSLLFWKRTMMPGAAIRIGSALLDAPAVQEGWYIVDGQQRTTAMAAALLDLDQADDLRWMVRFDPLSDTFLSGPPPPEQVGRHVPLSALGDLRRLSRWLRDCLLDEDTQSRVEAVQQRLLDYELPAYLMDTENPEALKGVFARLNSTGVRMRPDEVFQALLGTQSRNRGPLDLGSLQQACDLDGFGQPPRPEILKAVLAMSGLDPSRRLEDLGEQAPSKLVSASDAVEALRHTVAFFQASLLEDQPGPGIPAYSFIPYPVAFVLLSRWFHLFPEADATIRIELSRWLWRGVATGVHQRAAVSAMRLQVREIVPDQMELSLKRLLDSVGEPSRSDWSLEKFHANHAASRVELLALLALEPRDLSGPVSWRALVSDGQRVAREIVASPAWGGLDDESRSLARTAANRALLDARHTGLRAEFKTWQFDRDKEALESHLIDRVSFDALVAGDEVVFLRHRAARLRSAVSAFLSRMAGLGEPRLRPVESYFEGEAAEGQQRGLPGL